MDSERERSRALERDQEREDARQREERTKHHVVRTKPLSQQANLDDIALAQNVFLQEMATDPNKICFAFGGVYPGRSAAKGKLHATHTVSYSVGAAGHYQLHVCLRRDSAPLPGSPFALVVAPGDAYPLSTKLPLPLLGVFELFRSEESESQLARCACRVVLKTADKMGNACSRGGANLHCGATDGSSGVTSSCKDLGDGSYAIEFVSDTSSGAKEVYVKIDGLHVIGSPAMLRLTSGTPDISKTEVVSFPSKAEAGQTVMIRVKCKDSNGRPALGNTLLFGLTILPATDKRSDWTTALAHPTRQTITGEELRLHFSPIRAGEFKAFLWVLEGGRRRAAVHAAQARRGSLRGGPRRHHASHAPAPNETMGLRMSLESSDAAPRRSRESHETAPRKSRESSDAAPRRSRESHETAPRKSRESQEAVPPYSLDSHEATSAPTGAAVAAAAPAIAAPFSSTKSYLLPPSAAAAAASPHVSSKATPARRRAGGALPFEEDAMVPTPGIGKDRRPVNGGKGECFTVKILPGAPSVVHSYLDGVSLSSNGNWEIFRSDDSSHGKLAKEENSGYGKTKHAKEDGPDRASLPPGALFIGDTIRISPFIIDRFGNPSAADDSLAITVITKAGEEVLRAQHTTHLGQPGYDVRYEIKRRGLHTLHVSLGGQHITGSPMSWNAILPERAANGGEWLTSSEETAVESTTSKLPNDNIAPPPSFETAEIVAS